MLILRQALIFVAAWCFFWGTAVLVLRAAVGLPRRPLLWGSVGVLLAIGAAAFLARRRVPTGEAVRALLDRQSGCGGLLMAAEAANIGYWQQRMSSLAAPRLRWRGGRSWTIFTTAAVFVVFSFLVPLRFAALTSDRPLEIDEQVEKLAAQMETLKQEQMIDLAKAETLEQKLQQLQQEAAGEDPAKTWEALDHLQDTISKMAQEAAEEALADTERLTETETLAEGLTEDGSKMDPKLTAEAMEELSEMMQQASKDVGALGNHLSEHLQTAMKEGSLGPEQLKHLSAALRQAKGDITDRLKKLREAGLVDLKTIHACRKAGQRDSSGLAAFLSQNASHMTVEEMLDQWRQGRPGGGGVNRGRGDAPMTWAASSSQDGVKFKEKVLPPAALGALKESKLVGLSVGAPKAETASGSTPGALAGATDGGGSAYTQTVLPRHKGAVKRYFDRQ